MSGQRIAVAMAASVLIAFSALAETVAVTAVSATKADAEPSFDSGCKPYERLLKPLPFDSFETVKRHPLNVESGESSSVSLTSRYTLALQNVEIEDDGRVRALVVITGRPKSGGAPVRVLEMRAVLAKGKPLVIRGLPQDEGEIVAILDLR